MAILKNHSVRPLAVPDMPQLVALFAAYRRFYGLASDSRQLLSYLSGLKQAGASQVFVAARGPDLCGFTQLYPARCSLALAPYYILYDLYVDDDSRRQGLAGALLSVAAQWAAGQGAVRLELATGVDNLQAQALYRQLGWLQDKAFLHFELPLAD